MERCECEECGAMVTDGEITPCGDLCCGDCGWLHQERCTEPECTMEAQ